MKILGEWNRRLRASRFIYWLARSGAARSLAESNWLDLRSHVAMTTSRRRRFRESTERQNAFLDCIFQAKVFHLQNNVDFLENGHFNSKSINLPKNHQNQPCCLDFQYKKAILRINIEFFLKKTQNFRSYTIWLLINKHLPQLTTQEHSYTFNQGL